MSDTEKTITIDIGLDAKDKNYITENSTLSGNNPVALYESAVLAKNDLNLQAQRLLRTIISLIRPDDAPGKVYTFNLSEYANLYGIRGKVNANLINAAKALIVPIELPIDDGYATSYISKIHIRDNEVMIAFNEDLLPYYKALNNKQYPLININQFECSYSFQFYDYFILQMGNRTECKIEMTVDYMRNWLCLDGKYPMYANFKKRVIEPVMQDLNNKRNDNSFNLDVSFNEIKSGRKVAAIEFLITKIKGAETTAENKLNSFYNTLQPDTQLAYDQFIKIGITPGLIIKKIKEFGEEKFLKIWYYVRNIDKPEQQNVRYIAACINGGFTSEEAESSTFKISDIFDGIEKALIIPSSELEDIEFVEKFFQSLSKQKQEEIFCDVKDDLKTIPTVYKHISAMTLQKIMNTRGIKNFFFATLTSLVYRQDKYKVMIANYKDSMPDDQKDDLEYKSERKALLQKLSKLGLAKKGGYLEMLENNSDISNARIKDAIDSYKAGMAAGRKLDAGWLRKLIDEDYHFIDHVNEIQEREEKHLQEKVSAQRLLDEAMAHMGFVSKPIADVDAIKPQIRKSNAKKYSESEKNELRNYFMDLSFLEKNTILEELKGRSEMLRWKIEQKKGFEDMWADVSLQILLIKATEKLKKSRKQ